MGSLTEYLIIEFVRKSDSQVERLLLNRPDIFDGYTEDEFRNGLRRALRDRRGAADPLSGADALSYEIPSAARDLGPRMTAVQQNRLAAGGLSRVASSAAVAIMLSLLYPTLFAVSKNWYAFNSRELTLLVAGMILLGIALWLAYLALTPAIVRLLKAFGARAEPAVPYVAPALLALFCIWAISLFFDGTLRSVFGSKWAARGVSFLAVVGLSWLFVRGKHATFNAILALVSLVCLLEFAMSYVSSTGAGLEQIPLSGEEDFEAAQFATKPNIYFFIYDAYGSGEAYANNFGFDNSKQYALLEERKFKVAHTLSNYTDTWSTTLGFFLGRHHYYGLQSGNEDAKFGRSILSGKAHNPVMETLRRNGYRVQFIHEKEIFLADQGTIDFVYPSPPPHRVLKIFGSSRLEQAVFGRGSGGPAVDMQQQTLFDRLPAISEDPTRPWFTFYWVALPSHANKRKFFTELEAFQREFVERTKLANAHMLATMDRIVAQDPKAVIIIIGDHGAWRYSRVWSTDRDPNKAFEKAGIDAITATLDFFGVMIAIRSAGLCDDDVYKGITPVNVMRVVFACLSKDRHLVSGAADDLSIFALRDELWLTGRKGRALAAWERLEMRK